MNKAANRSTDIAIFGSFSLQGGVQRRLANIIKIWTEAGLHVELVLYREGVCFYPDEIGELVSTVHLGTHRKITTLWALWRYLRRTQPRVLLSTAHLANVLASQLSLLPTTRTRRYLSVPNTFGSSHRRSESKQKAKLAQIRRTYHRSDGIIAISQGVYDDLMHTVGVGDVPLHLIRNGSVTAENLQRAQEAVNHPWLSPQHDVPVVISVGRLNPQKDQFTLIDAVAEVQKQRRCRLIILGDGPLRSQLQERARRVGLEQHFDLPGFVDNPYAWMMKADCFVLSSRWEGFPNALAEALGLGVPVISTDCPSGPADILGGGRYGKLVPMGDVRAMANAIARTLDGEHESFDLSEAVRDFTAETAARKYLEVFGLVDSHGSS